MKTSSRALSLFGAEHQLHKAAEKCSELSAAINRWMIDPEEEDHVAEEIADVEIMLDQLHEIISHDRIEAWKTHKILRLEANLNLVEDARR